MKRARRPATVPVTLAALFLLGASVPAQAQRQLRDPRELPFSLGKGFSKVFDHGRTGQTGAPSAPPSCSPAGSPVRSGFSGVVNRYYRTGQPGGSLSPSAPLPSRPDPHEHPWGRQQRWDGVVVQSPGSVAAPAANPFGPNARVVYLRPGRIVRLNDYGTTIFQGYSPTCEPGYGYVSPFAIYNCPPYVGASYVLLSTPYLYLNGRERGVYSAAGAVDDTRDHTLRAALNDLTRFWEENDVRALRRRVSPDFAVAVFGGERHLYSLRQADFLALTADALDRVRTVSLRFDDVRDRTDGLVNVYATHVYRLRDESGSAAPRVARLRYTLVYVDGDWYVSAISLAPEIS